MTHLSRLARTVTVRFVLAATALLYFAQPATLVVAPPSMAAMTTTPSTAPELGRVVVFGDSTSSRLYGTWDNPNTFNSWSPSHNAWSIDAQGGSNVTTLTDRVRFHLANVDSAPSVAVIALGTNPAAPGDTWWKWNYEQAMDLFPASTRFVFVVPIRLAVGTAERKAKAEDVERYARYMNEIAAARADTVLAAWRQHVLQHNNGDPVTGVGDMLNDGIHQQNPFGRAAWMDLLDDAVARALALQLP